MNESCREKTEQISKLFELEEENISNQENDIKMLSTRTEELSSLQMGVQTLSLPTASTFKGTYHKEFNNLGLKNKIEEVEKNWSFMHTNAYKKEILMANDGNYIFQCKSKSGSFEADSNLNVVRKIH